jgi:hypothetical protein
MVYLRTSFLIGFFFLCSFGWSKVWTTNTGSKSEGELFEVLGDRIGLLIKGREYHFSLARFIQADQDYVRRWKMTPRCPSCSKPLGTRTIEAGGVKYHTSCFRCMVCRSGFRGEINSVVMHGMEWFMLNIFRQLVYAVPVLEYL